MNRPALETGFRRVLKGATPEDRAEFEAAWRREHRVLNPSPEQIHLDTIKWVVTALKAFAADSHDFPTEKAQFCALHALRVQEFNRPLKTEESEQLRRASRAIWVATTPKGAA